MKETFTDFPEDRPEHSAPVDAGIAMPLPRQDPFVVMNSFLILGFAICAEVTATLALKAADGFTRPGPTVIVALGYGTALWLMSTSMDMLPIGVVYAIWSGVGMVGAALGGALLYGEPLNATLLTGIGVIAVGVTILAIGQGQH
ncbi:DMT family transporter [Methylorubrum zatmanii]|uniref:DMT family transporter n=1 Tax=Methylorubrum zatmanii TaxID=29429 RepID=A0ABW1WSE2_9HYPH|nr:multidrug efflux SMR transporter [Methylorubrum zatmanii]